MTNSLTYADAGVDIDKANELIKSIRNLAKGTSTAGVIGEIGGFGGLFSLNNTSIKEPVLVSSTDGVGTKLKIAFMMDKHDTVGIDLVAMSVNDIVAQGGKPLFFLDYLSVGKLKTAIVVDIIKGISEGCRLANCALLGGETAEMPGFYKDTEYDLAGFAVGILDKSKIIDGSKIHGSGYNLIGLASSGLHSNGYSLVRKICFEILKLNVDSQIPEFGRTLGEELLEPTRIYSGTIQSLLQDSPILGISHITGGGIIDNILRIIPDTCGIDIQLKSWETLPIFDFLQKAGKISNEEMMRTFNNGIGLILVIHEKWTDKIMTALSDKNEKAYMIGQIVERQNTELRINWV